ncbi:MAG: hypothetical protein KDA64_02930 [Rhodospirillaceae bacterium]|nr:hypothetical protein [Rhodospirillaceae bacterium]
MKCIVPLAGPDLKTEAYGFRPLLTVDGRTLLDAALDDRPWRGDLAGSDYIFVLRDVPGLAELTDVLDARWPGHRRVVLSAVTGGAMLSALAGLVLADAAAPVVVDLADILFSRMDGDLAGMFAGDPGLGAAVPVFQADDACYSYLEMRDGWAVRSVEKQVISTHASAGVYVFRTPATYLAAAAWCLEHADAVTVRGLHFVCPMVNGVVAGGLRVAAPAVADANPVSKMFHERA